MTNQMAGRNRSGNRPGKQLGTGQHHTTRLCLELMESEAAGSKNAGYGLRSGILFIGGMLLGAKEVFVLWTSKKTLFGLQRINAAENHLPEEAIQYVADTCSRMKRCGAEIGSGL